MSEQFEYYDIVDEVPEAGAHTAPPAIEVARVDRLPFEELSPQEVEIICVYALADDDPCLNKCAIAALNRLVGRDRRCPVDPYTIEDGRE